MVHRRYERLSGLDASMLALEDHDAHMHIGGVTLFDAGGRAVRILMDQPAAAGLHEVRWNGLDEQENRLPAGVYFCKVQAGGRSVAQRLTILP